MQEAFDEFREFLASRDAHMPCYLQRVSAYAGAGAEAGSWGLCRVRW